MKKTKNFLSLVLVLALIIGTCGNVVMASAATKSSWSFKTTSGKTVEVNGTITLQKNEYQDFNLYKSGSEITKSDSRYTVTWSSSDEDIIWINSKTGQARGDKFGNMKTDSGNAKITAKIKNKTTGAVAYRAFNVTVGIVEEEEQELTQVDHLGIRFKDGTDLSQALKIDSTYTLETIAYDKDNKPVPEEEFSLYYAYFCNQPGITLSGSTFKPVKDGEYTITVGAFETEAEAKAATSVQNALFTAQLKNLVVEANKAKIVSIRQVDLYTVALTFNKPEYAKTLASNNALLTATYDISGYKYNTDFQELVIDEKDPATVLVTLFSGLTEGITYTFTFKDVEPVTASVTGSGTKPAQIVLEPAQVEVEREYYFKVKILNEKGVDITEIAPYTCTFETLNTDFAQPFILDTNYIYFFEPGKQATIRAKLELGYDTNGNPIKPLESVASFISIPKAQPIIGSCNGFALVNEVSPAVENLTYDGGLKTLCIGDSGYYIYATYPYTDEFRETHKRYIAGGRDTTDGIPYTYRSSNEHILMVGPDGLIYPFSKGTAAVYILGENDRPVGAVNISVTDRRALTTFAVTNQSATKLSATGNTSGQEVITLNLDAKDQLGAKVNTVHYTYKIVEPANLEFSTLFNHSLEGNTLKIWEGPLLASTVTTTSPVRRFTIEVTAMDGEKVIPQRFFFTVKNVTNATATTPRLNISKTNIDLKLDKDNLSDYESVIQVVSTDSSGYFMRCENVKLIHSASEALTSPDSYSVQILYRNSISVDDSILTVATADDRLTLKPVTTSGGNEITKAQLGAYTVLLYRGNGTKAQPVSSTSIMLTDSTPPLSVTVKKKEITDTSLTTIKDALSITRGGTDVSASVTLISPNPTMIGNTSCHLSSLVLHIKASELNPEWKTNELYKDAYTKVTLNELNLLFKLKY